MDVTPSTSKGLPSTSTAVASVPVTVRPITNLEIDDVDEQLWKMDGKIQRKRDEKL